MPDPPPTTATHFWVHREHHQHTWSAPASSACPQTPPSAAATLLWLASTHRRCQRSLATVIGNSSYHYVPCMNVVIFLIFVDFLGHRAASGASPEFRPSPTTSAASATPSGPPRRLRQPPGYRAVLPNFPQAPRAAAPPWTTAALPLLRPQHYAGAREEEDDCSGYCSFILFF